MKNIIRFWLFLLLISVSLRADPIGLRLPDSTVTEGDIVDIPVYVDSSLTGSDVYAYRLKLQFNGNKMQPLSAHAGGTLSANFGDPTINTGLDGYVILAGAGSAPLSGTGVLVFIRFEMIRSGYTSLAFTGAQDNYFNEGSPEIIFDDGSISIASLILPAISIYPNSRTMLAGDSIQFSVSGDTTGPFAWSVDDGSVATISSRGMLHAIDRGATRVRVTDSAGLMDSTSGLIEVLNLTLELPDTSVWQNDTVDIPIVYHELSDIDIYSGQFYLSYYSHRLTILNVIQTGTILEHAADVTLHNSPGRSDLAFAGTDPIPADGILMILRVQSLPGNTSSTPISFNDVIFNEDIPAQVEDGFLSVLTPPGLNISPTYSDPLMAGDTLRFTATGGIPPYSYQTSDPAIASIDQEGLLTALGSGLLTVTVSDAFGNTRSSAGIQVYDTWVSIPDTSATIGQSFELPVFIGALPAGQLVNSIEVTFSYQIPELEFMEIVNDGTLTAGWTFSQVAENNTIQIAGAGANGFSQAGAMFKIRFMVTSELSVDEMAFIWIDDLLLNEGMPAAQTSNGTIRGREQNDPPEITSPAFCSAVEDEYFIYRATASDPEDYPLTFTFSEQPDWLTAQADSIYGFPGEGVLVDSFQVSVSDGEWTTSQTVVITVTGVNDAPVITSADSVEAIEGVPFQYLATAFDPEDSTLVFSFENLPDWLTARADSVFGIPLEGMADTSFTVIVSDGELTDTLDVILHVIPVNDPPVFTSADLVSAMEDMPFVYQATAVDPEDSTLIFSFQELPGWLTSRADSVFGIPLEGMADTSFTVIVSDGELADTLDVFLQVIPVNDPPVFTSADSVFAVEDMPFVYQATAVDPEDSTLIFSFQELPDWLTARADSVFGIPLEGTADTSFTVIVSDGDLTDTLRVDIFIDWVNDAPVIASIADTSMLEDQVITVMLFVSDTDSEELTVTAVSDTNAVGLVVVSDTALVVTPLANWYGTAFLQVMVDDGEFRDTTAFVLDVIPVNDAPEAFELISPADSSINVSDTLMLFEWSAAGDVDGDTPGYGLVLTADGFELLLTTRETSLEVNIQEMDLPRDVFITWQVFATDTSDTTWSDQIWSFKIDGTVGTESSAAVPRDYALEQNYPNPFNPSTTIRFALPETSHVKLVVYDLTGREVITLRNGEYGTGWHTVRWSGVTASGKPAGAGIYLLSLQAADFNSVMKMTLMK